MDEQVRITVGQLGDMVTLTVLGQVIQLTPERAYQISSGLNLLADRIRDAARQPSTLNK